MKAKIILFFLALFGLTPTQAITKSRWPKCTKDNSDLLNYYASIFERNAQNSVVKREMTWTFSCLHASVIKDENNDSMFSYQIYKCCAACEFPDFSLCALANYPNWLCGSEAYDCVFGCRDEDSVLEAVVAASSLGLSRKREYIDEVNITDSQAIRARKELRRLRRQKKCYEKTCTMKNGVRDCCWKSTCVELKHLVTELDKKKKTRENQLKKLAKAASTTTSPTTTAPTKKKG